MRLGLARGLRSGLMAERKLKGRVVQEISKCETIRSFIEELSKPHRAVHASSPMLTMHASLVE